MVPSFTALLVAISSFFSLSASPAPHPVERTHAVCSAPAAGDVACLAKVYGYASDGHVAPAARTASLPTGLNPVQLRSAYQIPAATGGRVAVIGAYDNPNAKADLDAYSQTFGLAKLPNCTNSSQASCFAKYDQRGGTFYPTRNRGWAFETALDVETVHAACPTCRIDLIEANTASIANLTTAVDRAVALGSKVISLSWGASEFGNETAYDPHFANAGVTFVSATGDWGYGAVWPAASSQVIGVGGTTLALNADGSRYAETAWSGGGSGCSLFESKPAWQHDTGCAHRTISDIAAVADPATGLAVYSSYNPYGAGWFQVGGTSLSTPVVASMVALAAPADQTTLFTKLYAAAGTTKLYDVISGSNGNCSPAYLCHAGAGYDGPTGLGAPIGLDAL